jgi:hypothetical protein
MTFGLGSEPVALPARRANPDLNNRGYSFWSRHQLDRDRGPIRAAQFRANVVRAQGRSDL